MRKNTDVVRPKGLTEEHLNYLDRLRESGVTNMFGAGEYLMETFDIERETASSFLFYWMATFGDRRAEKRRIHE